MNIIVILIAVSFLVALLFLIAFIASVKSGQFDDTYSPSRRILFDDKEEQATKTGDKKSKK